nr:hypothetical protein [Tanacetum cinerariifolium]
MDFEELRMLAKAWFLKTETHSECMHVSREHINNLLIVQRTDMAGGSVSKAAGEVNEPEGVQISGFLCQNGFQACEVIRAAQPADTNASSKLRLSHPQTRPGRNTCSKA